MCKYMSRKLNRADKVSTWRLCMGCGACKWECPNDAISLRDMTEIGIRPFVDESKCENCGECVEVCPGIKLEHDPFPVGAIDELKQAWGPILEIWEGYAADDEIRFAGSSGGMATALALYGLESGIAGGVLHTGVDKNEPIRNVPVYSKTKDQLLVCTGSRYAPAAPCQAFGVMKKQNCKSIFIGKPCDIAALNKARKLDPELDKKVALTISIFCAGTPTTKGTLAVLEEMGVGNISELESFRYRGDGWPGLAAAKLKGQSTEYKMTYAQAWGDILSKYGQLRCRLCPDSTGEFADISCGDPWYRKVESDEPGRSLVLVRTERGRQFLKEAIHAGYVSFEQAEPDILPRSQKSILSRRRHLWGRLLAMRAMLVPTPRFRGFSLVANWHNLPMLKRLHGIGGTLWRIISRKWTKQDKSIMQKLNYMEQPV